MYRTSCLGPLVFMLACGSAAGMSQQECWLKEMPGVKNDAVAIQKIIKCNEYESVDKQKWTGWFGGRSAGWCIEKYAEDTVSPQAVWYIQAACYQLYPVE